VAVGFFYPQAISHFLNNVKTRHISGVVGYLNGEKRPWQLDGNWIEFAEPSRLAENDEIR
jgi:hypothetical protein